MSKQDINKKRAAKLFPEYNKIKTLCSHTLYITYKAGVVS